MLFRIIKVCRMACRSKHHQGLACAIARAVSAESDLSGAEPIPTEYLTQVRPVQYIVALTNSPGSCFYLLHVLRSALHVFSLSS